MSKQKEEKQKELYTILPTDSSTFTTSLDKIESIKTSNFDFDGKWKLVTDSSQENQYLYLIFEGRKIYSNLNADYSNQNEQKNNLKEAYKVFAIYDKCPDEEGTYNKEGNFLVFGSGHEKLVCYEVIYFNPTKFILYDVAKGGELEFRKVE
ncbi:hypothetical protein V9L05_21445 [Bernardetia sp. Wsw4-3y2]|uniref:hypothetical protein n=1 Tax=Bernardetia sp. Wsw4-3y2 TaxID=3127471 RepID=UPI0030CB783D